MAAACRCARCGPSWPASRCRDDDHSMMLTPSVRRSKHDEVGLEVSDVFRFNQPNAVTLRCSARRHMRLHAAAQCAEPRRATAFGTRYRLGRASFEARARRHDRSGSLAKARAPQDDGERSGLNEAKLIALRVRIVTDSKSCEASSAPFARLVARSTFSANPSGGFGVSASALAPSDAQRQLQRRMRSAFRNEALCPTLIGRGSLQPFSIHSLPSH